MQLNIKLLLTLLMPYDKNSPKGMGKPMKRNSIPLILFLLMIPLFLMGQNKVILLNGESKSYSALSIEKESITIKNDGVNTSLKKSNLLCVVPAKKASFTFLENNGKKLGIKKKDIQNNYQGTDLVKILAYKYYNSEQEAEQIYQLNPIDNITEEEFIVIFDQTQKDILGRTIVSTVVGIVAATAALILGLSSFISTKRDLDALNSLSYQDDISRGIDLSSRNHAIYNQGMLACTASP